MNKPSWQDGRNISPRTDIRVKDVRFTDDVMSVDLMDGRTISVPIVWFPRLHSATKAQRDNWEKASAGFGIHWPDLDEDLGTAGLLRSADESAETGRRASGG